MQLVAPSVSDLNFRIRAMRFPPASNAGSNFPARVEARQRSPKLSISAKGEHPVTEAAIAVQPAHDAARIGVAAQLGRILRRDGSVAGQGLRRPVLAERHFEPDRGCAAFKTSDIGPQFGPGAVIASEDHCDFLAFPWGCAGR